MASWMFSIASASVLPCDQQPGSPGTETLTPSSEWCRAILYFIVTGPVSLRLGVPVLSNGSRLGPTRGLSRRSTS